MISRKRIKLDTVQMVNGDHQCVGCNKTVNPAFCYTGSILQTGKPIGYTRVSDKTLPILGTMETPEKVYILGGETIKEARRFSFFPRKKGLICPECAADYSVYTRKDGSYEPIVRLEHTPNQTLIPSREIIRGSVSDSQEKPTDKPKSVVNRADNHWLNVGRR
jgi:hypothetical protein